MKRLLGSADELDISSAMLASAAAESGTVAAAAPRGPVAAGFDSCAAADTCSC